MLNRQIEPNIGALIILLQSPSRVLPYSIVET